MFFRKKSSNQNPKYPVNGFSITSDANYTRVEFGNKTIFIFDSNVDQKRAPQRMLIVIPYYNDTVTRDDVTQLLKTILGNNIERSDRINDVNKQNADQYQLSMVDSKSPYGMVKPEYYDDARSQFIASHVHLKAGIAGNIIINDQEVIQGIRSYINQHHNGISVTVPDNKDNHAPHLQGGIRGFQHSGASS